MSPEEKDEEENGDRQVVKPLYWISSSKKDLRKFPEDVKDLMGFALWQAQIGNKHVDAKPLRGFKGAGVLEIVADHDGDTYRGVYTVKFSGAVYTLHAFQKKSKKGIKTPQSDIDVIHQRLKMAVEHYKQWRRSQPKEEPKK
jgi:phage-related protein